MPLFLAGGLSPKASTAGVSPPRWMLLFVIVYFSIALSGVVLANFTKKVNGKAAKCNARRADIAVLNAAKLGVEGVDILSAASGGSSKGCEKARRFWITALADDSPPSAWGIGIMSRHPASIMSRHRFFLNEFTV